MQSTDIMHYETRAIRDELHASRARLFSAKTRIPAQLTQQQVKGPDLDWIQPTTQAHIEDETLASGDPKYEEMRLVLLTWENTVQRNSPAKERAFYSALRSLLSETATETQEDQRTVMIQAAYNWFNKNRPRGGGEDPAISAALAASISIKPVVGTEKAGLQSRTSTVLLSPHILHQQQQNLVGPVGLATTPGARRSVTAQTPQPGSQHDFFALYTGASPPATRGAAMRSAPAGAAGGGLPGYSAAALAAAARPTPAPPSKSVEAPLIMQPAVSPSRYGVARQESAAAQEDAFAPSAPGTLLMPKSKARVAFGTTVDESQPGSLGRAGKGALKSSSSQIRDKQADASWFSGPYKPGPQNTSGAPVTRAGNILAAADRSINRMPDTEEIGHLRNKWSNMDKQIVAADADIESKMQQWSLQRARLEEEIIRRQEASRFAAPSSRSPIGGDDEDDEYDGQDDQNAAPAVAPGVMSAGLLSAQAQGYLSPYVGFTTDRANAEEGLPPIPGLMQQAGVASTARDVRAAAQEEYAYITDRLHELGVSRVMRSSVVEHALAPIPDRPFLDCIAKLPQPGSTLASRPGSVQAAKKKATSAKKKKAVKK